jgi:PAS domain S-box-containing protein
MPAMMSYRNAPIKQKLLIIILVTTAIGLAIAGTGFVLVDSYLFRNAMNRDLTALASIVGDNSTAALQFDDPQVATEILSALRVRPHLIAGCLYRPDGSPFAQYSRLKNPAICPPPTARDGIVSTSGTLAVSRGVLLEGRRIGTLMLIYDRGEMWERIQLYSAIVLLILVACTAIAFILSSRLREAFTMPISRLSRAAASISETGDYRIRVDKVAADELGVLADAFNDMLGRIQSRDLEAQDARTSLETTLSSIGDAVISTDSGGRILFANPVAHSLLGWAKAELLGRHIDEVFRIQNEYTRQKVTSPVERVLREGMIVGLANHTILTTRDGSEVPIDDSAAPIKHGGRTLGVVLVFRDVSDRRRAQQDAGYLAAIVESSDDAIVGKSPQGIIQTWNLGAERLYGYKAKEVIGRAMLELLPPELKHEESNFLERLARGERIVHFETIRLRKDGSSVDVSLTISPIRDKAGQIVGISHVGRDITDQKRTSEQMRQTQKLESLGVLAGGIAHDFNNLLTGILGNASIALEDLPPDSPAREAVDAIITASDRAAALARQMLAYSGKGRFVLERIDLSEKVRQTLPLIKSAIPPTVEVQLKLEEPLPLIEADSVQMQQLIMNVIINAAEAIPDQQRGAVIVSTHRESIDDEYVRKHEGSSTSQLSPGPHVLFEVVDTGSGMDAGTLSRIFDPFFTTKFTGRGLGLAAVLGIVRGQHGAVQVSSTPGQGTAFRFLFPVAEKSGKDPGNAAQRASSEDLRGAGVVLVVDDEQIVRDMAKQGLERYGYTVLVAENGVQGLEIFRRHAERIQCVVLDLTMPKMSGEEALDHMRRVRTDVPIILSSGFNEAQAVQRFEGKGLAGFLQKPYRASALLEKIKEITTSSAKSAPRIQ